LDDWSLFPFTKFKSNQQELLVMLRILNQQHYKKQSRVNNHNHFIFEIGRAVKLVLEIKKMLNNSDK